MVNLKELEQIIGYRFHKIELLRQAMTHSSFTNEQKINRQKHYERLEFLGDAVLEMTSSDFLYFKYPDMSEGNLTKTRAALVCEQSLYDTGSKLRLGEYMRFGKGEAQNGGRRRESIVADAVEAVIGAIYLDGGIEKAREFILKFVLNDLENKKLFYDAKSNLQEIVQNNKMGQLMYELISEDGPEHDKIFSTAVYLDKKKLGKGSGRTKKEAEQHAAYEALMKIR